MDSRLGAIRLMAAALLVSLGAGTPEAQVEEVPAVTIAGPVEGGVGRGVELMAIAVGFSEQVTYSWSVESGPAVIEADGSSATVEGLDAGEVVVKVVAGDGASGSAEDTHRMMVAFFDYSSKPNDMNGDGLLDISDPVALLSHMFLGGPGSPCGDGLLTHPSTLALLDANGSGEIDISDPLHVLNFIFLGGPRPVNCSDDTCPCLLIVDCPVNQVGDCSF